MPTTSFGSSAAAFSGQFSQSNGNADFVLSGRLARGFYTNNCRVDIQFTGTEATVSVAVAPGSPLWVSVDGGAWVDKAPASGWQVVTLFTGLSDTAHSVKIRGSFGVYLDLSTGATFTVTGASPACVPLPASAGMQFLTAQTFADPLARQQILTLARPEVGFAAANNGFTGVTLIQPVFPVLAGGVWIYGAAPDTGGQYRWAMTLGDATEVKIWTRHDGTASFALLVDGVSQGTVVTSSLGGIDEWLTLATGLSGSAQHTYSVAVCNFIQAEAGNGSGSFYAIKTNGTTTTIGTRPALRPLLLVLGGEIVYWQAQASGDFTRGWMHKLCEPLGYQSANGGIHTIYLKNYTGNYGTLPAGLGGQYFVGPWSLEARAAGDIGLIVAASQTPTLVVVNIGDADAVNHYAGGGLPTETTAEHQASMTATIAAIATALPGVPILVVGILPRYNANRANLAPWRTAQQVGAAAGAGSSVVRYSDPTTIGLDDATGTPNATYYLSVPAPLNLNDAGATLLASALAPQVTQMLAPSGGASMLLGF